MSAMPFASGVQVQVDDGATGWHTVTVTIT
jgi:hypothetical protein